VSPDGIVDAIEDCGGVLKLNACLLNWCCKKCYAGFRDRSSYAPV
jgi:hypothetical protein